MSRDHSAGIIESVLPFLSETLLHSALLIGSIKSKEINLLLEAPSFTEIVIVDSSLFNLSADELSQQSATLSKSGKQVLVVPAIAFALPIMLHPGIDFIWFGNRPDFPENNNPLEHWRYAVTAGGAMCGFFGENVFERSETNVFALHHGVPELIDDNGLWLLPMPNDNSHRHYSTHGYSLSTDVAPAWAEAYSQTALLIGLFGVQTGAEVGVARGHHSAHLLETFPDLTWHSIDPWRHFDIGYDDPANMPQSEFDALFERVSALLSSFGSRSVIHRKTSGQASDDFEQARLDFVFIDANHSYEAVGEDLRLWWQKIKPGGIFAGHDYGHSNFPGVKQAVDEFLAAMGLWPGQLGGTVWWVQKPFFEQQEQISTKASPRQSLTHHLPPNSLQANEVPLKIHVGCGPRILKGWKNIDLAFEPYENYLQYYTDEFYGPEVRGSKDEFFALDVTKTPLPFADNSAAIVFDEDFLEHLDQREAILFLAETYRVLQPGGIHRIITPDLDWVFDTKCSLQSGFNGVDQSEWVQWHHKEIFSKVYLQYIAEKIGYQVIFRKRFESASPHLPKEYRPGKGIPEESHLYADLLKPIN